MDRNMYRRTSWIVSLQLLLLFACMGGLVAPERSFAASSSVQSMIFPAPREMSVQGGEFALDDQVRIVVPPDASPQDLFLAGALSDELGDRFALHLKTEHPTTSALRGRAIVMGSVMNPLVRRYCAEHGLKVSAAIPGPEGYILQISKDVVLVAGSDDQGAFYGMQSLRQLVTEQQGRLSFPGVQIRDWPDKPFRGIKLYLPGREEIPFFKRFVRDFMALYKFNTLIMEMNANMRLDKHPEVNTGWLNLIRDTNYSRLNYPPDHFHGVEQNSSHQDTADGEILEKEEVADLARWVKRYRVELIPELPSFTHSYYLLASHKELAAVPQHKWPDTYCPSNEKSYQLLFDVYDEYIDLLKPKMIHIGHDELFTPLDTTEQCDDKDIGELYGRDVKMIHDHLAARGVKVALWGDMLLESVRGKGTQKRVAPDGWAYSVAGGMTPEQVRRLIPKDVLVFNWFWDSYAPDADPKGPSHEEELERMGFKEIYGNMTPEVAGWDREKTRSSILGGAPSAWFRTNEVGFGKDLMADFLGTADTLWTGDTIAPKELSGTIQAMLPEIRVRLHGAVTPSQTESNIVPVDISASFNMPANSRALGVDLTGLSTGIEHLGKISFDLKDANGKIAIQVGTNGKESTGLAKEVSGIPIGQDATSLIFLQASARPAYNRESYRVLWDQEDTADLLGWYEVVYEDGFVVTIPIRYGVNIAEWNWDKRASPQDYCYESDALATGGTESQGITFFAYEWTNPRMGKVIKEIRLKGTTGFRGGSDEFIDDYGPVIPSNAVILKAISVVKARTSVDVNVDRK